MERWEDGPVVAHRAERLVQPFEWSARLRWERGFLSSLALPENDEGAGLEVDIAPAKATPTLGILIAKDSPYRERLSKRAARRARGRKVL